MSSIGYAIFKDTSDFKKSTDFVIDSNGLFNELNLSKYLKIDNSIKLDTGYKLMYLQRTESKVGHSVKDAYIVVLIEKITCNTKNLIIGSAIAFKDFQVHEKKIIDGVYYLFNQLKRNFESEDNTLSKDLGVILPSINKDFNIFKDVKLNPLSVKSYINAFCEVNLITEDAKLYLNHFCNNQSLKNIECLILSSRADLTTRLSQSTYKKIDVTKLIKQRGSNPTEIELIQQQLERAQKSKNRAHKIKNGYALSSLIFLISSITLGVLLYSQTNNKTNTYSTNTENELYTVEDTFYINHNAYNVNIRSTPTSKLENIKTTLSDGDEVYVLGFDKKTLWAKISYNKGKSTGYVSNDFISKRVNTSRLKVLNKVGYIKSNYTVLYPFPKTSEGNSTRQALTFLDKDDQILVKNKEHRRGWYSVQVSKKNKIYNGYIQEQKFRFQ